MCQIVKRKSHNAREIHISNFQQHQKLLLLYRKVTLEAIEEADSDLYQTSKTELYENV